MRLAEFQRMGDGVRAIWENLGAEETEGEPKSMSDYPVKTVTIDGGQAILQGKNWDGGDWHNLTDANGIPLKGPGIARVALNPWQIRPVLVSGDHVTVTIVATK